MEPVDVLLNEFIEAWNAGQRPSVDEYVERAPEPERNELAGLIGAFLEIAPAPDYSPAQLAELRNDPAVKEISKLVESPAGLWPMLLPRLRKRARMTREQVAAGLAHALGLEGREQKVHRYYHQMESGTLDPGGVSGKVLGALSKMFGVRETELEPGESLASFGVSASAELLYTRMEDVMEDRLEGAPKLAPRSPGEMDEVDRLFRGGR